MQSWEVTVVAFTSHLTQEEWELDARSHDLLACSSTAHCHPDRSNHEGVAPVLLLRDLLADDINCWAEYGQEVQA